jgi:putative oxygen-independent coproporphyrinogen III oxidase
MRAGERCAAIARAARRLPAHTQLRVATSVYVHFPWCLQKCPYCDFASAAIRRPDVPHVAYADAVLRELAFRAPSLAGETLASVFFGGGTPSLWSAREIGRVLAGVRSAFSREVAPLEVTVECNPSSLDREVARALREAGVTRASIGVQSLDDAQLRFLGRLHDADAGLRAVEAALCELPRASGDLIFGLPGQAPDAAVAEARRLMSTGLRHLSAYSLTIEPNTQFGKLHEKGRLPLAVEDDVALGFEAISAALAAEGFEHYEVSNYARPGERSQHNQHYWQGGAYLGLGAGAVGALPLRGSLPSRADTQDAPRARRYRNDPNPERYAARSGSADVEVFEEQLSPDDLVREHLMLGLRTSDGVDLARTQAATGRDPLAGRHTALDRGLGRGELLLEGGVLRVPRSRWLHLDSIVAALF